MYELLARVCRKPKEVSIDRKYNQVDQGSEMSVVSVGMVYRLGLSKRSLAEVGFKGLSLRIRQSRLSGERTEGSLVIDLSMRMEVLQLL